MSDSIPSTVTMWPTMGHTGTLHNVPQYSMHCLNVTHYGPHWDAASCSTVFHAPTKCDPLSATLGRCIMSSSIPCTYSMWPTMRHTGTLHHFQQYSMHLLNVTHYGPHWDAVSCPAVFHARTQCDPLWATLGRCIMSSSIPCTDSM